MMSASEGGHGKANVVWEVACTLQHKSVPKADNGGMGSKNPKIWRMSLMEAPYAARLSPGIHSNRSAGAYS